MEHWTRDIDFTSVLWNKKPMKNGKGPTPERNSRTSKEKSRGTAWAERTRAQCNTLSASQREKLLDRALKIAYGAETEPAAPARR